MKSFAFGKNRSGEKEPDAEKDAAKTARVVVERATTPGTEQAAENAKGLPQRTHLDTSTPIVRRKSGASDWAEGSEIWSAMSSPIVGRKKRTMDSARVEADPMDGVSVDVSLRVDSSQAWRLASFFGEALQDSSFCSAVQTDLESSRAGIESEMDVSQSSAKKRRASPKGLKGSSTDDSGFLKTGTKGRKKKRVIRNESESRSLDKTDASIGSTSERKRESE